MIGSLILLSSLMVGQVEAAGDQPQPDAAQPNAAQAAQAEAQAADAAVRKQVRTLVRQLDGDELAERDQAEKDLIKLGADALDHLPRITDNTPAEVKVRLTRIVKAIESAAAAAAAKGSRVNLAGEMTLADAMAALEKQSGNQVVGYTGRSGAITLTAKDVPYWEALDQVLDQAGLTINTFGGRRKMLTVQAKPPEMAPRYGSANYSGPFRFEATRIEATRDLRNPEIEGLRLQLEVSWEPRSTPILLTQDLANIDAEDEDGNPLAIAAEQGQRIAPVEADIASVDLEIPFSLPSRDVKRIGKLKGTLNALVPGRVETFEFKDLLDAENDEQQRAGVTVIVEKVEKSDELYVIYMKIRFDKAENALESHRGWVFGNDAFMVDDKGQRIENAGLETTSQDVNEVGLAYLFALDAEPKNYKFVYRTPALIVRIPVKFDLRDIQLP